MSEPTRATGVLAEALRSSVAALRLLLGAAALLYLGSGLYVVRQNERAVELRFGAPVGPGEAQVNGPGLHIAWPAPIGEVRRVSVGAPHELKSEAFWYHLTDSERATGRENAPTETLRPGLDGYLLLPDGVLHARWQVEYEVTDPVRYLFAAASPDELVESALAAAATSSSARSGLGAALQEPAALREDVQAALEQRLSALDLGLRVTTVRLAELVPPRQVRKAFDAAGQAVNERQQALDAATGYASKRRQDAEAEAARLVAEANGRKATYLARLKAEAQEFGRLLPEYRRNPTVLRRQRLIETLRRVLSAAEVVLVPRSGSFDLQVDRTPKPPVTPKEPAQ